MEHRKLGKEGPLVSALGLGCRGCLPRMDQLTILPLRK
jgi:aryl-alcohol dehydrogenase-like predicted oxidoreductase